MQQSDGNNVYMSDEMKRLAAFERGVAANTGNNEKPFDFNSLPPDRQDQILGWEAIGEEYANNPAGEQTSEAVEVNDVYTEPSDQSVEAIAETPGNPESPESLEQDKPRSIDEIRRSAVIKAGAANQSQFIQSATAKEIDAEDIRMTDEERAAYDDMMYQMRLGNNSTSVAVINEITGLDRISGSNTAFNQTIESNGVAAMMQEAKQPQSEKNLGLDVSEQVAAAGISSIEEGKLATQVEAAKLFDEQNSDSLLETNAANVDKASEAVQAVDYSQNNGYMGGYGSTEQLSRERIDQANQQAQEIKNIA